MIVFTKHNSNSGSHEVARVELAGKHDLWFVASAHEAAARQAKKNGGFLTRYLTARAYYRVAEELRAEVRITSGPVEMNFEGKPARHVLEAVMVGAPALAQERVALGRPATAAELLLTEGNLTVVSEESGKTGSAFEW